MKNKVLKVHENDNIIITLEPLSKNETAEINGRKLIIGEDISAGHKISYTNISKDSK